MSDTGIATAPGDGLDRSMTKDALTYWIEFYCASYGIDANVMKALAMSESGYANPAYMVNPTDPNGGAYGPFQFLVPSARPYLLLIDHINYTDDQIKNILLTDSDRASHIAVAYVKDLSNKHGGNLQAAILEYKGAVSAAAQSKVWGIFTALLDKFESGEYA